MNIEITVGLGSSTGPIDYGNLLWTGHGGGPELPPTRGGKGASKLFCGFVSAAIQPFFDEILKGW
jgi:hypothetical protein